MKCAVVLALFVCGCCGDRAALIHRAEIAVEHHEVWIHDTDGLYDTMRNGSTCMIRDVLREDLHRSLAYAMKDR